MSQPLLDTVEPDELEPPRNVPVQPTVSSQSSEQNRMATNPSDAESGMYALLLLVRAMALIPFLQVLRAYSDRFFRLLPVHNYIELTSSLSVCPPCSSLLPLLFQSCSFVSIYPVRFLHGQLRACSKWPIYSSVLQVS
jgi:hypothetical protein